MSFSTTNFITDVAVRAWKKKFNGILNVANLPPCQRSKFLEVIHYMYGLKGTTWVEKELDVDSVFSIDKHPNLPCSQRSNSRLSCEKLKLLYPFKSIL